MKVNRYILTIRSITFVVSVAALASTSPAVANPPVFIDVNPVVDADYRDGGAPDAAKVELGRVLFFDKELSGNRNTSCATCHHPFAATSDGLSLPVGEGAMGLSVTRDTGEGQDEVVERVPRNSPALFNLGAIEFSTMFHDGRVAGSPGGFLSPAGPDLPNGLDSALAVQAMFPVTSATEMAGQLRENKIAKAAAANDLPKIWALLADRLRAIPEYVALFNAAYGIDAEDITYVHAANAIAAFEEAAWRDDNSPFDQYLRGDEDAMSEAAIRGMDLFYGDAGCSGCHGGPFQTDQNFHAIAMPQIGPGKGDGPSGHEDFGRERVAGIPQDRFRFRTPSLRNVALTAPYGHAGAYASLEAAVRHHLDPVAALNEYDGSEAVLPSRGDLDAIDFAVMDDPALVADIAAANELAPWPATDNEVADILAFLHALTDPDALDLRDDVPPSVPSGLPVFD
jgi:cytochrome c peroxidase